MIQPVFSKNTDNAENLFFKNNLIPSFVSSVYTKLPSQLKFQSDNFYSSPNSLFFLTIRNLSKNISDDLLDYQSKNVEIKIYSLVDRLKSEIFPYAEKYDTKGIALSSNEKLIGICCISPNLISSINGTNFISSDISDENLERFFKKYKSIVITKRDIYLKNFAPDKILKEMVDNFNNKQMDNFFSCFSLKYKFMSVFSNLMQKHSFDYDPNKTFFGNLKDIKSIQLISTQNMLSTSQMSSTVIYETIFAITDKNNTETRQKYSIFFSYSQIFGYRIYDVKPKAKTQTQQQIQEQVINDNETISADTNKTE